MASLDDAITRNSPSGPASMRPAAPTSSTSTQRSANRVSSSTTSKSATSVSASSTSVLANSASLGTRPPITVPATSSLRSEGQRPPALCYDGRGPAGWPQFPH